MKEDSLKKLYDILKSEDKHVAIYGAGYVAKRFYKILKSKNLNSKIECFVVTEGKESIIDDVPVVPLSQLSIKDTFFLVAVHETIKDDIINLLVRNKSTSYLWVAPLIFNLLLGEPVDKNREVSLKDIWLTIRPSYVMAIRFLAIDQFYGKNKDGYDIYKLFFNMINDSGTSEKRLRAFIALIESIDVQGFDEKKAITLLNNNVCIDGGHRLSLALYHGKDTIMCDIYSGNLDYTEIHDEKLVITGENARLYGFSECVIDRLEEINHQIDTRFGLCSI